MLTSAINNINILSLYKH